MRKTILTISFLALVCAFAAEQKPANDFPIAQLRYKDGSRLFHLHSPFGFVAEWQANDGKPRFFLYDKRRSNISVRRDFNTFLDGLSKFPDGADMAWVNTCGAPLHYGMPQKMLSSIENVLKQKHFKMAGIEENNFVLCTCEATNLVFLTSPP